MAVSDDLLHHPHRLSAVRKQIESVVADLGAAAGFLVDEDGTPFATVGHVEFQLPHPLPSLREGDALLKALVGEDPSEVDGGRILVERVGDRALLTLLFEKPLPSTRKRATRRRSRDCARAVAHLL